MTIEQKETATITLPLLPLRGILLYPHTVVHLDVGRERSIAAIDEAMLENREIFLVMQKEAETDEPAPKDLFEVGTVGEIKQILEMPGGTVRILVEGLYRASILDYIQMEPYVLTELQPDQETYLPASTETVALTRSLKEKFEQFVKLNKGISPETLTNILGLEDASALSDIVASNLNLPLQQRQEVLETFDLEKRIVLLLSI